MEIINTINTIIIKHFLMFTIAEQNKPTDFALKVIYMNSIHQYFLFYNN